MLLALPEPKLEGRKRPGQVRDGLRVAAAMALDRSLGNLAQELHGPALQHAERPGHVRQALAVPFGGDADLSNGTCFNSATVAGYKVGASADGRAWPSGDFQRANKNGPFESDQETGRKGSQSARLRQLVDAVV